MSEHSDTTAQACEGAQAGGAREAQACEGAQVCGEAQAPGGVREAQAAQAHEQERPSGGSAVKRAFAEDGALKTHVGGQALIEGVMMRGKYNWAAAVREPNGSIYIEEHDLASGRPKNSWLYWPIVRGCRSFVESLVLGFKALEIAAMHAYAEEGEEGEEKEEPDKGAASEEGAQASAGAEGDTAGIDVIVADGQGADAASVVDEVDAAGEFDASDESDEPGESDVSGESDASGSFAAPDSLAASNEHTFSWKDDFGRPDTIIDALGAQTSLEPVTVPVAHACSGELSGEGGLSVEEPSSSQSAKSDVAAKGDKPAKSESAAAKPADVKDAKPAKSDDAAKDEETYEFGEKEMAISMALGLVLGVVLFVVLPAGVANLIVGEYDDKTLAWNLIDGVVRVAVFVFYIWLIGRMEDIKRMYGYHGAEHKTIHCFEHGLPLTPENARSFPRLHVRCGTAFLIMVMIIAIFVYTITPIGALITAWGVPSGAPKFVLVIVVRILLMPLIAGISYEITVKWAGSHPENPLVKVVLWPGMQMQRLTTREPDDSQLECAIAAMQAVLAREEAEEASEGVAGVANERAGEGAAA